MSRVGRKPIRVPEKVKIVQDERTVSVEGPLGRVSLAMPLGVSLRQEGDVVHVVAPPRSRTNRGFQGLVRATLARMIGGVQTGYSRSLEIQGVGYRAEVNGDTLRMAVGHSHPDFIKIPSGLRVEVDKSQTKMQVRGIDLQAVGQLAAEIRSVRRPEPYKGKGVRFAGEAVRRKAGKTGSK